jgi:hypothetical protein
MEEGHARTGRFRDIVPLAERLERDSEIGRPPLEAMGVRLRAFRELRAGDERLPQPLDDQIAQLNRRERPDEQVERIREQVEKLNS